MEIQIKKRSRFFPILFFVIFLVGIIFSIYTFYFKKNSTPNTLLILKSTTVQKGTVEESFDATGIIKPKAGSLITISSQVSGLINSVFVHVGKEVKKGTPLVNIDKKEIEIKKEELLAILQKTQAELDRLRILYPIHISEADNAIRLSKQQSLLAKNAKRRSEKQKQSEEEKEQLDHTILETTIALSTAQSKKEKIEKEFILQEKASKATVKQVQSQLNSLSTRDSYYSILSPIAGIVSNIFVQSGEYITVSKAVVTVVNPTQMEMWVYIDENDIGSVKDSLEVTFKVDSLPDIVFTGVITQIYPEPEIRNGVVYYKAVVPIKEEYTKQLYLEMTTQVYISRGKQDNVLRIPNTAIKWSNSEQVVYVEKDGVFAPRSILLGNRGNSYSEVLSGLTEGETIATQIEVTAGK